jgi:adenine deaminase
MVSAGEFARQVVARGTTTVFVDPHELGNVGGIPAIRWLLKEGRKYPWNFNLLLPSCVPASPYETPGAVLEAEDLAELKDEANVFGLGEMMNYPGVIQGDEQVWQKLTLFQDKFIDGHAPGVMGKELNAYLLGGIKADHEVTTPEEAAEKIRAGMYVMIREGSAARNLEALLKAVTPENFSRFLFATDDREPNDLIQEGHIDHMVRRAIQLGLSPLDAIRMATINTAMALGLKNSGAIAPGYKADLLVINDLKALEVKEVYKDGKLVAKDGQALFEAHKTDLTQIPECIGQSVKAILPSPDRFKLPKGKTYRVIQVIPGEIVTKAVTATNNEVANLAENDLCLMAVVERNHGHPNLGLGLLKGLGIKRGAIATTIAHDCHPIIVAGINSQDMAAAVAILKETQGGIVVVDEGQVKALLPLPLAGLMSPEPIEAVAKKLEELEEASNALGVTIKSPFMTLSFLALSVIPELKLTDRGLLDVTQFKPVDLVIQ